MTNWINVEDRLPEDGQLVIIETNEDNCFYTDQNGKQRLWQHHIAIIRRGKIPGDNDDIEFGDQWENNEVPYEWEGEGPQDWFGQEVVRWMPIPE